ncbi:hypothetical protein LCGC14_1638240 [marine sediment metagenome]|uniref:Uncharacterized protein n=1 Tax=marine sediment metagenome TaxID=412755 RepID=A0A0F9IMY1_9ZZZZ
MRGELYTQVFNLWLAVSFLVMVLIPKQHTLLKHDNKKLRILIKFDELTRNPSNL